MKRFLTTAATALVLSTNAYAAAHMAQVGSYQIDASKDFYASDLIGMRVYATKDQMGDKPVQAGAQKNWDDIGEINDIIVSKDGQIQAVILGVGGFLGIGEKDVAVAMSDVKMVQEDGQSAGNFFLVVNTDKATLEAAPAFKREPMPQNGAANTNASGSANTNAAAMPKQADSANQTATADANANAAAKPADSNVTVTTNSDNAAANTDTSAQIKADVNTAADKTADAMDKAADKTANAASDAANATAQAVDNAATATGNAVDNMTTTTTTTSTADTTAGAAAPTGTVGNRTVLNQPNIQREGYQPVPASEISTDQLDNAAVYGVNDERIGEIDKLLLSKDGQAEQAVINVGGFLGIGEKPVAVTFKELSIMRSSNGGDLRVYMDATKDQLKAQPKYVAKN
ncbi:PRC-barrel domain-containing protein [Brevirhabdus sp.]|uniref:PRC-barrel domain-containing protein n=1 Tax=Brevirhabdus sp. TaxID=2004514 RepID=UPI0040596150